MKLKELRRVAAEKLTGCSEGRPLYAVDLILAQTLGVAKSMLITKYEDIVSPQVCEKIISMVAQRAEGEPLSYILGEAEFYGRPFFVGKGVLIPRPETELLVEEILKYSADGAVFADWCVGSGCIGATMLLETRNTRCVGIDKNQQALGWARRNIERYSLTERFTLVQNEEPLLADFSGGFFDFIVANPPYIPSGEIAELMRDVRDYEPIDALDGGKDGLDLYKKLFAVFPGLLKCGGLCGLEVAGDAHSAKILKIAPDSFVLERKIRDYNGMLRHIIWRNKSLA